MPAKVALEPVFNKARNRWRVDVPASITQGKRVRAHFRTRQAAREYIDRVNGAEPTAIVDPRLAHDAETARQRLEAAGLDLTLAESVATLIEATKALNGTGTLLAAAQAFRRDHEERESSQLVRKAVAAYLDSRANLRDSTLRSYRYTLEKVLLPLHDKVLADVSTSDLAKLFEGKGATSGRMHRANIGGLWRWAAKAPRSWCKVETFEALEIARTSSDADIQILTPQDVRALLRAAETEGHAAAVAYAVAVFGGVRMAELERLTWRDVHSDHIEIGRNVAKRHSRRLVPICPTLRAWIDAHRDGAEDNQSLVPANWTDVSKSVRRRAGWAVEARLLDYPPRPTRGAWPANACRHTCASVQIATGSTLEDLVFKFGHAGGHEILRAHYVSRLTKKDALAILATGPNDKKLSNVQAA